jgi:hypothetical protein
MAGVHAAMTVRHFSVEGDIILVARLEAMVGVS